MEENFVENNTTQFADQTGFLIEGEHHVKHIIDKQSYNRTNIGQRRLFKPTTKDAYTGQVDLIEQMIEIPDPRDPENRHKLYFSSECNRCMYMKTFGGVPLTYRSSERDNELFNEIFNKTYKGHFNFVEKRRRMKEAERRRREKNNE
jgi:hypothetical protein